MMRLRFKGSNYHGWQKQPNAISVQHAVEEALSKVFRTPIEVIGCGRTDAGVHAEDFYLHFDLYKPLETPLIDVFYKLYRMRLDGIQFRALFEVNDTVNARFSAFRRTYEYRIIQEWNPFLEGLAAHIFQNLDVEKMKQATLHLIGKHDFGAFAKSNSQVNHNICTVYSAEWIQDNDLLIFRIAANRFLRNMVRAIVGTLIDVGKNRLEPDDIINVMASGSRSQAGASVPAHGLYLTKVEYPKDIIPPFEPNLINYLRS